MIKIIIGAILAVAGGFMTGWGNNTRQSFEYSFAKALGRHDADIAKVDAIFYCGILLLIVGIAVLLYGIVKKASGTAKLTTGTGAKPTAHTLNCVCSKCGTQLTSGTVFCPNCGSNEKRVNNAASATTVFCGNCGEKAAPGEQFCHKCGNKL